MLGEQTRDVFRRYVSLYEVAADDGGMARLGLGRDAEFALH